MLVAVASAVVQLPANSQPARDCESKEYANLKQCLENEGWTVVCPPERNHELSVLAHLIDGKRTAYQNGKLRHRLVVAAKPIDVKPGETKVSRFFSKNGDGCWHTFETTDGSRVMRLTREMPRIVFDKESKNGHTIHPLADVWRKTVFLHTVVELMDGDSVVFAWYTPNYDMAVFATKIGK